MTRQRRGGEQWAEIVQVSMTLITYRMLADDRRMSLDMTWEQYTALRPKVGDIGVLVHYESLGWRFYKEAVLV